MTNVKNKRSVSKMTLNIVRERILHKGYANNSDIRKFIPCGTDRASEIFCEITLATENEGKINISKHVLAKRLLPYVGLSEKEIVNYAEKERAIAATMTQE